MDRSDIARMAKLNVIGVPQPFWHVKGDYFRDIEARYLGYARAEKAYPMQSLAKAGILLASASDYPVQVPSPPLLGIQQGVTRCEPGETDPGEIKLGGVLGDQAGRCTGRCGHVTDGANVREKKED